MSRIALVLLLFLTACGGTLSDEQRKRIRESMEEGQIRKVSDAELTEAAFALGRKVSSVIEQSDRNLTNKSFLDSLQQELSVEILFLQPGDSMLADVERQLIEAYTSGSGVVQLSDNVQNMNNDTLLYTKPVLRDLPDGTSEFTRALGIRMPVKSVILSIED